MSLFSLTDYSGNNDRRVDQGFTLVELLISTAIIVIISIIVLFRFGSFESTTLLKSVAYEVALTLREAQVYSVSVRGSSGEFRVPYGMSFTPHSKQYVFFADSNENGQYDGGSEAINTFELQRTIRIGEICVDDGSGEVCSDGSGGLVQLDVTFLRPEFTPIFTATGGSFSGIENAAIKVVGGNLGEVWRVGVGMTGQITVTKE